MLAAFVATPRVFAAESVPVEGRIVPNRIAAGVGSTLPFRLELSTTVAYARVAVRLKVPEGMTLVGGTAEAEIAGFAPGQDRVFEYRLRLDQPGEKKVWVEAEVLGIAPAIMRRNVLAIVNPADDTKLKPTIRRDPDGTSYQVQGISPKQSP